MFEKSWGSQPEMSVKRRVWGTGVRARIITYHSTIVVSPTTPIENKIIVYQMSYGPRQLKYLLVDNGCL